MTHGRPTAADLAFAGLGLLWRRPGVWAAWSAVSLASSGLLSGAAAVMLGDGPARLQALKTADPAQAAALMVRLAPASLGLALLALAFYAVMGAAAIRAMLRPEEPAWRRIRLGAQEVRQAAVIVASSSLVAAAYLALLLAAFLLAAFAPPSVGGLLRVVLGAAALVVTAWLALRLWLAGPATFDAGRVRVLASWRLTRGRVWTLAGAFLLAVVLALMVAVACWMLVAGVQLATGGFGAGRSLAAQAVALLLSAAVFPVNLMLFAGPSAAAYRAFAGPGPTPGGRWPGQETAGRL